MQIYLAPMEGITGYVVRNAFSHHFGHIDKYFTPFIPAAKRMSRKILRDLSPACNEGIRLIPQLISNRSEEVLNMIRQLKDLGFSEVNLNLGCPSGTVVSKGRGSGLLRDPQELDRFLNGIYEKADIPVSVKTRIGFEDPSMWTALLDVYRRYPVHELIIHPRLRREMYTGAVHLDAFAQACEACDPSRLCYNGDLFDIRRYEEIRTRFPDISMVMIGRGLLGRPYLSWLIQSTDMEGDCESIFSLTSAQLRSRLRAFCDEIFEEYRKIFQSERDVCMHMKEIWANLGLSFKDSERLVRKLMKCRTAPEYHGIVRQIFDTLALSDQDLFRE